MDASLVTRGSILLVGYDDRPLGSTGDELQLDALPQSEGRIKIRKPKRGYSEEKERRGVLRFRGIWSTVRGKASAFHEGKRWEWGPLDWLVQLAVGAPAMEFGILMSSASAEGKNDVDEGIEVDRNDGVREPGLITRQLFPPEPVVMNGLRPSAEASFSPSSSSPQRKDLSFYQEADVPTKVTVLHQQQQVKRSRRGPRSRSSQYRGVTFYRRTGRWESHIWAYDRAAIKFRGVEADINFNLSDYQEDLEQVKRNALEEIV
ncbi:hypothetical protein BHM03_00037036 [Ensete ventricosum]|nr:hypothetical protein BHM03_00037036 [Ensete ventricosum]